MPLDKGDQIELLIQRIGYLEATEAGWDHAMAIEVRDLKQQLKELKEDE